jgi:serine/threonine-protein kinase
VAIDREPATTTTTSASTLPKVVGGRRSRLPWLVAGGAVLGLGAAVALTSRSGPDEEMVHDSPAAATATEQPATSPEAEPQVTVPSNAPESSAVPVGTAPSAVASTALSAAVSPAPAKPAPRPVGKPAPATRPAPAAKPAPAAPKPRPPQVDCNPPYRVDANGIRHPKPECM